MMKKSLVAALTAACLGSVALPATAAVDVWVEAAPPAPRYEVVPGPRHGYVWAPGHWEWNGHRYYWVGGTWLRERPGYHYTAPSWVQRDGRWYYERRGWEHHEGRGGPHGDRDHDGVPNRYDRDRDNDGVPNRYDQRPDNPRRY